MPLTVILSSLLAVAVGSPLFIKTPGAQVFASASIRSRVLATLPVGTVVTWKGASPDDKTLHQVQLADGRVGFVRMRDLAPSDPSKPSTPSPQLDFAAFMDAGTGPYDHCFDPLGDAGVPRRR